MVLIGLFIPLADTDQILAREQGLAAARARLQAQHDEQIKDFAEKQKQVANVFEIQSYLPKWRYWDM